MLQPGRQFTAVNTTGYRFGFNGQEKSEEIEPNTTTAEYWQYDSRIGRRWNLDPVVKPWESSYSVLSNNPIWKLDPNGDDDFFNDHGGFLYSTKTGTDIKIIHKDKIYLLSNFLPNTPANVKGLVKNY